MKQVSTYPTPRPSPTSRRSDTPLAVEHRPWEEVIRRIDRLWVPDSAPHHSVVGQTRSGKSYLITRGLLPLVARDNVLTIDCKGGDKTLMGACGKPVHRIPGRTRKLSSEQKPKENWFHLLVKDSRAEAQQQVYEALEQVYREGDWVVVVDETRALTDPSNQRSSPGLGMGPQLDRLWLRGGGRGITLIAGTQAPRFVPSAFYDQPSFVWISRIRDRRAHERVMEIGSLTREHIPVIAGIRKREWLVMDDEEDETWQALTTLTT